MKKLALPLGLTAVLFAFVFSLLIDQLESWLNFRVPWLITTPLAIVISYFAAIRLAPRIQADIPPPQIVQTATLWAAGYFLLLKVLLVVGAGSFGFLRYLWRVEQWSLAVAILGVLSFLKPRYLLLVGLTAFAMQFQAVLLLSILTSRLPDWLQFCITLAIAFFIARWLSLGEDSPADRVRKPILLWCFAAAAAMVMTISALPFSFGVYTEQVIWLAFLVSFVLMVDSIAPGDPDHKASVLGADNALMFMMLVALYSTVAMVFKVYDIITGKIPFTANDKLRVWLPFLISVGIAIAIMAFLRLGSRMRSDTPGRGALRWGVILFFVAVLAGGSIFGANANDGSVINILVVFVWLAILVLPLMVAAQILMSIGLLRVLFHLNPRQS
jgi:hypothetical protein